MTTHATDNALKDSETAQPRHHAWYGSDGDNQNRGQHDETNKGRGADHSHGFYHSGR